MTQAWDFVDASILWARPVLDASVDELELSVRASNVLRHYQELVDGKYVVRPIKTIGELVKYPAYLLLRQPNCGRKTIKEIEETLAARGLGLSK